MADKKVSDLIAAEQIYEDDVFVLEQDGKAKKLTGQILMNWLTAAADGHGGISDISKISTSGLKDTYRITLADKTAFDFVVTNGEKGDPGFSIFYANHDVNYTEGSIGSHVIAKTFIVTNGRTIQAGDLIVTSNGILCKVTSVSVSHVTCAPLADISGEQGVPGTPGDKGDPGQDGISATHSWNGTVLTVTSASGSSSADLKGAKGDDGDDGTSVTIRDIIESSDDGGTNVVMFSDGNNLMIKNGISARHSWSGTVLNVTSASGSSSADLKGDPGEKGADGASFNLYSGTADFSGFASLPTSWIDVGESDIYGNKVYGVPNSLVFVFPRVPAKAGDTFTWSASVRSDSPTNGFRIYAYEYDPQNSGLLVEGSMQPAEGFGTEEVTFSRTYTCQNNCMLEIRLTPYLIDTYDLLYFSSFKLELGKVDQPRWCKSVDDLKGEKGDPGADGTMSFKDLTDEQKASLVGSDGSGINLYNGSADFSGEWENLGLWTNTGTTDSNGNVVLRGQCTSNRDCLYQLIPAKAGETFTLSALLRCDYSGVPVPQYALEYDPDTREMLDTQSFDAVMSSTEEARVSFTHTCRNNCLLGMGLITMTAPFYISSLKLESGKVENPRWCKSVDDLKGDKGDKGDPGEVDYSRIKNADWAQDDVYAPDYVKNRTHYEDPIYLKWMTPFTLDFDGRDSYVLEGASLYESSFDSSKQYIARLGYNTAYVKCTYDKSTGGIIANFISGALKIKFNTDGKLEVTDVKRAYNGSYMLIIEYKKGTRLQKIDPKFLPNSVGSKDAVLYTPQTLTEAQKAQARKNIGVTGSGSSDYDKFRQNMTLDYGYDAETGTSYTTIRVYKKKTDGTLQYPFVFVPNKNGAPICSGLDVATNYGFPLTINAGCGGTVGYPIGTLISNGVVVNQGPTEPHPTSLPLTIDSNGDLWYANADDDAESMVANGIVSAVCGFMPIIKNYEAVPDTEWTTGVDHYTQRAQRQIIGQYANGDYAIITCDGRGFANSPGWTIAEEQNICLNLGLKFAYNLDGGGSTSVVIGKKQLNLIYEGATGRKVPAFIVFNGGTVAPDADVPDEPDAPDEPIELPDGYTLLDYVEVNGSQYVSSGIPETTDISVEYAFAPNQNNGTNAAGHILSSTNTFTPFLRYASTGKDVMAKRVGNEQKLQYNFADNEKYTVKAYRDGTDDIYVNGLCIGSCAKGDAALSESNMLYLFAYGGALATTRFRASGKFYFMKVYDTNGALIRHFVPCTNASAVVGLFDIVNEVFYRSETGMDFYNGNVELPDFRILMHTKTTTLNDGTAAITSAANRCLAYAPITDDRVFYAQGQYWDESIYSPLRIPAGAMSARVIVPSDMRFSGIIYENHPTEANGLAVAKDYGSITDGRAIDVAEYNDGNHYLGAVIAYQSNADIPADFDTSVLDVYFVDSDGNRM